MLRILYASERPPYPFFLGGAARCAHRLLRAMSQRGRAECLAVGSADYDGAPWSWPGEEDFPDLEIRERTPPLIDIPAQDTASASRYGLDLHYPVQLLEGFQANLGHCIGQFRPDVVWTQLEGALEVLRLARSRGVQGLLYVHDAEDAPDYLRQCAAEGAHLLCSSRFLAERTTRITGRRARVVYPASHWCFDSRGHAEGFITLINPFRVKGLDVFLELARALPEQRFLLVESWRLEPAALQRLQARLATLPNVQFRHRVADIREIYRRTRLLLMPSTWEEGFGMVAVEAQSAGIPVIASARGGLPESVGEGGRLVQNYTDPAAWLQPVREVLGDDGRYAAWSERARSHAGSAKFDLNANAERFLEYCRQPPPRVAPARTALGRWLRRLRTGGRADRPSI